MGQPGSQPVEQPALISTLVCAGDTVWRHCRPATVTFSRLQLEVQETNAACRRLFGARRRRPVFHVDAQTAQVPVVWRATVRLVCTMQQPPPDDGEDLTDDGQESPDDGDDGQSAERFVLSLRQFCRVQQLLVQQCYLLDTMTSQESLTSQVDVVKSCDDTASRRTDAAADVCVVTDDSGGGGDDAEGCCCICLERRADVTLPCGHVYCDACIGAWSDAHGTCPMCRQLTAGQQWLLLPARQSPDGESASRPYDGHCSAKRARRVLAAGVMSLLRSMSGDRSDVQ